MSDERKFKFVSPGVFVDEIDNSQLPALPEPIGPIIIGRAQKGPSFRPTQVNSFSEFVDLFGNPVPGGDDRGDQWRSGTPLAPTYGVYAAQAYLRNNGPVTYVRLLGDHHENNDGTQYAKAGWINRDTSGNAVTPGAAMSNGGAFGLFLANSGSATHGVLADDPSGGGTGTENYASGALAAVFYLSEGAVVMSGTAAEPTFDESIGRGASPRVVNTTGSSIFVNALANGEYAVQIYTNGTGQPKEKFVFNFNRGSEKYIRKVFNTNPTLTNNSLIGSNTTRKTYWLGPTYDRHVAEIVTSGSEGAVDNGTSYGTHAFIAPIGAGTGYHANDFQLATRPAKSGWIISQDPRGTAGSSTHAANALAPAYSPVDTSVITKLFRFHGLNSGEWEQKNIKISIKDIKRSPSKDHPYGTFTVILRSMYDSDRTPRIIEQFGNVNLNPNSLDYIARRVGDMYSVYDTSRHRLVEHGTYENRSNFVRMEMNEAVNAGMANPELLPFGFQGAPRPKTETLIPIAEELSASMGSQNGSFTTNGSTANFIDAGLSACARAHVSASAAEYVWLPHAQYSASLAFPTIAMRKESLEGFMSDPKNAYWGFDSTVSGSSTVFDKSNWDVLAPLPVGLGSFDESSKTELGPSFSLDDLTAQGDNIIEWVSGSRAEGRSISARSGSYNDVLTSGFDRFTFPIFGGFDGFDVTEKEPFNMTRALPSAATEKVYSMFYSAKKAVDICADAEFVEGNLMSMPGVTNENLTTHLINTCETRGDALAIIDPLGGYTPSTEDGTTEQSRIGTVTTVTDNMRSRELNSSYGATYFPWVQIRDNIAGRLVFVPPSIPAIGAMASSDARSAIWFAPAGFTRGGLSEGAAGLPVVSVRTKLTSKERDQLYDANINPIASFPSEGIVIFGQKTLQITDSALDRINVRRMMIYVKREISRIASRLLFDANVQSTWDRFVGQADPFLSDVKAGLGLTEYRIILDETTTTADLIDRNIMYAKIFLKPARAIEFIALDFVITRTGASFDD